MLFPSTIFLFGFLPVVLALYFALRTTGTRNALLLAASLLFYAFGEASLTLLLLASIALNWSMGRWIAAGRPVLPLALAANLTLLAIFKYANFLWDLAAPGFGALGLPLPALEPVPLPIGISFFTFQAMSYVIDVSRGDAPARSRPGPVALYISLFPQLIAGPIVRYREISDQLDRRESSVAEVALGARRFVVGLAKKVLIADSLAIPVDRIFALDPSQLSPAVAGLGALAFGFQIYFDFSGYSDMAIGLGHLFGFRFPENFAHPYTARSLREFWRRWHITLSTWFRDYLYIPLGGSRGSRLATARNLWIVFLLCGLWHGANWTFITWGALHGSFLVLERGSFGRWLARSPRAFQHLYTFSVVTTAWVLFRAENLSHALAYLSAPFAGATSPDYPVWYFLDPRTSSALAIAALGSLPWAPGALERGGAAQALIMVGLLVLCAMSVATGTHEAFIYFRF